MIDKKYHNYLSGKSVALVGPAEYLLDKFDPILPMMSFGKPTKHGATSGLSFTDDYILNNHIFP